MPLISDIITTYNRAHLLRGSIESALKQDFEDFELIVVDDGSTDQTPQVLGEFGERLTVLRRPNKGLSASRNLGLSHANGRYVALLDDDDFWFPWTLSTYAAAIDRHDSPCLISSRGIAFHDPSELRDVRPEEPRFQYFNDYYASYGPSYWVTPSGTLFRAEDARQAGGFFEFNYGHDENDLWLRMGDRDGFVIIDDPKCFGRREHAENISSFANRNVTRPQSYDVVRGTQYLLEQERRGAYPGGKPRSYERRGILTSHVRGVSLACAKRQHQSEGWAMYRQTFWWHLRLGRWRYLVAFPLISLKTAVTRSTYGRPR